MEHYRTVRLTSFVTSLQSSSKYIFKHGWEFDLAQHPIIMEAMCFNMSDEAGHIKSSIYNILEITKDQLDKDLKEIIDFHNKKDGYVQNLLLPPEQRLKPYLADVEKKAYSTVKDGEILVFGHTHRPFISDDGKIVNTGSWVKEAEFHNTFLEIDGNIMRLFQFNNEDAIVDTTEKLTLSIP